MGSFHKLEFTDPIYYPLKPPKFKNLFSNHGKGNKNKQTWECPWQRCPSPKAGFRMAALPGCFFQVYSPAPWLQYHPCVLQAPFWEKKITNVQYSEMWMKLNIWMLFHCCFKFSIPFMPPTTVHFSVIPSSRLALAGGFPSHAKFNGTPKKSVIKINDVLV